MAFWLIIQPWESSLSGRQPWARWRWAHSQWCAGHRKMAIGQLAFGRAKLPRGHAEEVIARLTIREITVERLGRDIGCWQRGHRWPSIHSATRIRSPIRTVVHACKSLTAPFPLVAGATTSGAMSANHWPQSSQVRPITENKIHHTLPKHRERMKAPREPSLPW